MNSILGAWLALLMLQAASEKASVAEELLQKAREALGVRARAPVSLRAVVKAGQATPVDHDPAPPSAFGLYPPNMLIRRTVGKGGADFNILQTLGFDGKQMWTHSVAYGGGDDGPSTNAMTSSTELR